ncbi:hypothetical protein EYF80_012383 [Liparis tanakae]|uniref:Uncharacterized protein n=1 Tax=Liparis tanakae TaxID=230148 RepID=A0A4Z2IHC4_9TELE|nr:hypothetical protein EYF80_012383 [Liparis tanakae]
MESSIVVSSLSRSGFDRPANPVLGHTGQLVHIFGIHFLIGFLVDQFHFLPKLLQFSTEGAKDCAEMFVGLNTSAGLGFETGSVVVGGDEESEVMEAAVSRIKGGKDGGLSTEGVVIGR